MSSQKSKFGFNYLTSGLQPGISCYYQGIKITKTKGFSGFNLAAKYKRNYRDRSSKEPWYIVTNLDNLSAAIDAYSKRMGIEEMFRDFKLGGYNLEITQGARSPSNFDNYFNNSCLFYFYFVRRVG